MKLVGNFAPVFQFVLPEPQNNPTCGPKANRYKLIAASISLDFSSPKSVLKAAKACFANIVEVSGAIIPREENQALPERMGLKVAEVMVDAGDSVTAGAGAGAVEAAQGRMVLIRAI